MSDVIEKREVPETGILKRWVARLGLRHQGVLLTCVRGCDVEERHGSSKLLTRAFRGEILNTHCADPSQAKSFIEVCSEEELQQRIDDVVKSHDHLPHHFLMHLIHGAEIIGYYSPDVIRRPYWKNFYYDMCEKFHMNRETKQQLDFRLNAEESVFADSQ